jgi:hypothetical protein
VGVLRLTGARCQRFVTSCPNPVFHDSSTAFSKAKILHRNKLKILGPRKSAMPRAHGLEDVTQAVRKQLLFEKK